MKHISLATCTALTLGLLGLSAPSAQAATPKYKVTADYVRAIDESGYDWAGSDEPYLVFSTVGADGTNASRKTPEFGDVDSGETRTFSGTNMCMFPVTCGSAIAPDGIGVSVQIWEADNGDASKVLAKTGEYFKQAKTIADYADASGWVSKAINVIGQATSWASQWQADDMIGTQTFTFPKADLTKYLTYVGDFYRVSKFFGDPNDSGYGTPGYYELRVKVTRVA